MLTMDFGTMPTREQYDRAWEEAMSSDDAVDGVHFHFGNDERVGNDELTQDELWAELQSALRDYQGEDLETAERAGEWISCVLGCLGVEWV